ncbi:hypothetical protein A2714_05050 [Candidatus Woesebacteria bacterium RIFCSPHIGHO2_01_FULL_38_9]|uniref:Adenylate kinase n=2 Tax=Candidatus Woeseibacteriota TaxID=1752722 RepID=A0A1F7Y2S7_9BACT|nr:MAG: hypothetical protein A2714_05050 [Candidatus Woesebacteria bacterium RIFCSPHIGHO2_01_FULL_38_9]OGM60901.1 MAG: hypothetical protein A3A75_02315 [Candidatus Woesebacteria bacterium RIFCSPLOWO2_01_FULL_39_10]
MTKEQGQVCFVGGINGAGKSTFLTEVEKRDPDIEIFHASPRLMELLGLVKDDYDGLRALPDSVKDVAFDSMMRQAVADHGVKTLLIDAHYLNLRRGKVTDVTGSWLEIMNALFLITAEPNNVLTRINNDQLRTGRDRALFPEASTIEQQSDILTGYIQATMDKVKAVSAEYSIPLFVINNEEGLIVQTVQTFLDIHAQLQRGKPDIED